MEEAGNPPIKIRLKRVTDGFLGNLITESQIKTQPETEDHHTNDSASSHIITQKTSEPAESHLQLNSGDHRSENKVIDTHPVDQPTQPDIQPHQGSPNEI